MLHAHCWCSIQHRRCAVVVCAGGDAQREINLIAASDSTCLRGLPASEHCSTACLHFQGAPPLKFAIFFAGALIRDRNLSYIYKEKVTLPSVHIIGDKDYVKEVGSAGVDDLLVELLPNIFAIEPCIAAETTQFVTAVV